MNGIKRETLWKLMGGLGTSTYKSKEAPTFLNPPGKEEEMIIIETLYFAHYIEIPPPCYWEGLL